MMFTLVLLCLPLVASSLSAVLQAKTSFSHPAFVSYNNNNRDGLLITQFSETSAGAVYSVSNVTALFATKSATATDALPSQLLGNDYTWPNVAEAIPAEAFSSEETTVLCGTVPIQQCQLLVVPDGFLTPGHKTGGLFILPTNTKGGEKQAKIALAPVESNWFYHKANWVDVDGDGLLDVVAARCNINAVGVAKGELVWFKHPATVTPKTTWQMKTLASGPDVITMIIPGKDEGMLYVVAAEFFAKKLSLTTIQRGGNPKVLSYTVLDSTLGAADDLHLADVDGDGVNEMVVTTHEGGNKGGVYAYELPEYLGGTAPDTNNWERIALSAAGSFVVTKAGMNQASPGFIYPIYPTNSQSKRPVWVIAGDGSQGVHVMTPVEDAANAYAYKTEKILEIGGTVGTIAVQDIDSDGTFELVVPDYDNSFVYFYTLK